MTQQAPNQQISSWNLSNEQVSNQHICNRLMSTYDLSIKRISTYRVSKEWISSYDFTAKWISNQLMPLSISLTRGFLLKTLVTNRVAISTFSYQQISTQHIPTFCLIYLQPLPILIVNENRSSSENLLLFLIIHAFLQKIQQCHQENIPTLVFVGIQTKIYRIQFS